MFAVVMDLAASANIAQSIYLDLRRQILSGRLAPGERLPGERELAQTYDTNRNTLREAVRRLEHAKLVTVRHGQGVTVSDFRRTGTMELLPPFLEAAPDLGEVARIVMDTLPARVMVIEFAARQAAHRAEPGDLARLADITDLLVAAFEKGDQKLVARGFHRWLDALIDAGHSVAIRWIGNPFLEAYRELLERFPALWVLDPTFPRHLEDVLGALRAGDEERLVVVIRAYYDRIDRAFVQVLGGALPPRAAPRAPQDRAGGSAPSKPRGGES